MTSSDHSESGADFSSKVRSVAGLLVAGFAGALNFIGLKSAEVSTVLRNEAHWPTLVLVLIVTGILTAVASVFAKPGETVSYWAWLASVGVLLVPISLTAALIEIPGITDEADVVWGLGIAAFGALLAAVSLVMDFVVLPIRRKRAQKILNGELPVPKKTRVTAQGLLVFVAVSLTACATYAALRLETVSQLNSTAAQLSARISETSVTAQLAVSIDASKMANADRVNVMVIGLQRGVQISQFCSDVPNIRGLTCRDAPCTVREHEIRHQPDVCNILSSGVYQPNADGSVRQTIEIPFSDVLYQRLELVGEVCAARDYGQSCKPDNSNVTSVDIQVPEDASRRKRG